jgi:hypothetical protein
MIEKNKANNDINWNITQYCFPKGPVRFIYILTKEYLLLSAEDSP